MVIWQKLPIFLQSNVVDCTCSATVLSLLVVNHWYTSIPVQHLTISQLQNSLIFSVQNFQRNSHVSIGSQFLHRRLNRDWVKHEFWLQFSLLLTSLQSDYSESRLRTSEFCWPRSAFDSAAPHVTLQLFQAQLRLMQLLFWRLLKLFLRALLKW